MLAERSTRAAAVITVFRREGLWPPLVPSIVLVECLSGRPDRDARTNQFIKTCDIQTVLGEKLARRAAHLRGLARRGSAVDAVVVAAAETGGTVCGGDVNDCDHWLRTPMTFSSSVVELVQGRRAAVRSD